MKSWSELLGEEDDDMEDDDDIDISQLTSPNLIKYSFVALIRDSMGPHDSNETDSYAKLHVPPI